MQMKEIADMWEKDSEMDDTELAVESIKIPQTHHKYLKILMAERIELIKQYGNRKKVKKLLCEYYLGELDDEELKSINRKQFFKKILKQEMDTYIESDDMMIEANIKTGLQQEKVEYVDSIIKQLNNRGFQIKNAIDWNRFTSGQ